MPTPAMKRMKKTEPPNEVAASGVGSSLRNGDHDVVGDLYEDLPQLGHHDGQGQFQIGFVLSFVG